MSIFAPFHYGSLDDLAESVLRPSSARFGGEEEEEEEEEGEDAGEPTFEAGEGENEDEGFEDEDFDDFEEIETPSSSSSASTFSAPSHAPKKPKAKKKPKKKKKMSCAKRLALIEQARSRMWNFNIGDPERAHWERVANARKRAMAKAFCSGVPL